MTAELLRTAAADMRAKAEAATPGPWAKGEYHGRDIADEGYSYITVEAGKAEVASTYPPGRDDDPCEANAAHIASWHPAVALAVADWLDIFAETWDSKFTLAAEREAAKDLASVYLGRTS